MSNVLCDCETAVGSYVSWQRLLGMIAFIVKSEQEYNELNNYIFSFAQGLNVFFHLLVTNCTKPFFANYKGVIATNKCSLIVQL